MRDARDHAFEDAAVARRRSVRIVERAEAQRVHHGDGPRAHGEDVAQNAADAGGRALERLDETGVVVRFDLERDRSPSRPPMSMMPAFSPGPCTTTCPRVGSFFRWMRELL